MGLMPADNCGECLTVERSVRGESYDAYAPGREAVVVFYRCPQCGHKWHTFWSLRWLGDAA